MQNDPDWKQTVQSETHIPTIKIPRRICRFWFFFVIVFNNGSKLWTFKLNRMLQKEPPWSLKYHKYKYFKYKYRNTQRTHLFSSRTLFWKEQKKPELWSASSWQQKPHWTGRRQQLLWIHKVHRVQPTVIRREELSQQSHDLTVTAAANITSTLFSPKEQCWHSCCVPVVTLDWLTFIAAVGVKPPNDVTVGMNAWPWITNWCSSPRWQTDPNIHCRSISILVSAVLSVCVNFTSFHGDKEMLASLFSLHTLINVEWKGERFLKQTQTHLCRLMASSLKAQWLAYNLLSQFVKLFSVLTPHFRGVDVCTALIVWLWEKTRKQGRRQGSRHEVETGETHLKLLFVALT